MKYSSLQHTGVRTFNTGELCGGVNLYDLPCNVADNQLTHCRNVWYDGGLLKTRPGLNGTTENILRQSLLNGEDYNYFLTDTVFYVDGEYKQIAVENYCEDDSRIYSYVYFIGSDKSITGAGHLLFNRIMDDIFYFPVNMLFYVGKPTNGGGLYVMLTMENIYNSEDKYCEIYEISAWLNSWIRVDDYYIPTVYINGRGNRYEMAKATNQAFTGNPLVLESPNMLNGRFHAYFTSDGYSSSFRLPFSHLSGAVVVCRVYHTLTDYVEWRVLSGRTYDVKQFYRANVRFTIDREKGVAYFTDDDGEYPIPMMSLYHENNIKITAYKEIENGFQNVVSSKYCTAVNSKILFVGGPNGNIAYSTSFSNPLYFPQDAIVEIGESDRPITALAIQESYIIAYKQSEVYAIKLTNGKAFNTNSLLVDNDSIFYSSDKMNTILISNNIGCENSRTVAVCGNQTVWLGNDGNIYTLKSVSSREIYEISKPIRPYLKKINKEQLLSAFSVAENGHYLLIIGEKAIIMEYTLSELKSQNNKNNSGTSGGIRWYIWGFPSDINLVGGMSNSGIIQFLCRGKGNKICYIASLDGETDSQIKFSEGQLTVENLNINSSISTKKFDFGNASARKNVENIFLSLSGKGDIEIKLNGRHFSMVNTCEDDGEDDTNSLKSVRLITRLNGIDSVYITATSNDIFSFGDITVYYR